MTYYDFLLAKRASGELKTLFALGLPVHLALWMEIYAYHLNHPELSQHQMALIFETSQKTIWKVYCFLNQSIEH